MLWFALAACIFSSRPVATPEQLAHAQSRVTEVARARDAALVARRAAMANAANLAPASGPCPIDVPVPSNQASASSLAVPALDVLDDRLDDLRGLLDGPAPPDPAELLRQADALALPDWDIVLLSRGTSTPIPAPDGTFRPGAIAGRVLVYSYPEQRVVCVADAVALSSDLQMNLLRAAIPQLRAVDP